MIKEKTVQKTLTPQEVRTILKTDNKEIVELCKKASSTSPAVRSILLSLQELESKLSDKISKVIDEKLEGMDDVVVELIRCKTDNETLKQKIVDLNKEIYQLKNELNSYKSVGFGFYKKKEVLIWE